MLIWKNFLPSQINQFFKEKSIIILFVLDRLKLIKGPLSTRTTLDKLGHLEMRLLSYLGLEVDIVGLQVPIIGLQFDVGLQVQIIGLQFDIVGLQVQIIGLQFDIVGLQVQIYRFTV